MPNELERRARELLAAEYDRDGRCNIARDLRLGFNNSAIDMAIRAIVAALQQAQQPDTLCEGCPPSGYPTDTTRCDPCPRRAAKDLTGDSAEKSPVGQQPGAQAVLSFAHFRAANVARCIKWHPEGIASWSPSDWLTAVTGELGELASLLKMRNRERDGLPGNKFSPTDKMIADELADVLTYLDLLAAVLGVDLGAAAVAKFNAVSERVGFPDRIDLAAPSIPEPSDEDVDAGVSTWVEIYCEDGRSIRETVHSILATYTALLRERIGTTPPPLPEGVSEEDVEVEAISLWRRFAPDDRIEWDEEPHKAEYRYAARSILESYRARLAAKGGV